MLRLIQRFYWPGQANWKAHKEAIINKRMHIQPKEVNDPLHECQMLVLGRDLRRYPHEVHVFVERILKKNPESITAQPLSFITYHASKHNLHQPKLWEILERFLQEELENLTPRMLFGCLYGYFRSSQGSHLAVKTLQHDFIEKAINQLNAEESHELVEAVLLNTRTDYNAGDFLVENIMPRVMHFWGKSKHSHMVKELTEFTQALVRFEMFDPSVWERVLKVYTVKHPYIIDHWAPLYEALVLARNAGMEKHSGLSLDEALDYYKKQYNENPDFSWKYDIDRLKFYDIHEMIAKANQGPDEMTWEIGEPMIKHRLPKWYFEMDIEMEDDVKGLFFEYNAIQQGTT